MATVQIPLLNTLKDYSFEVELERKTYVFRFRFNSREQFWYYDLLDVNQAVVQAGRKLVTNFPLTRTVSDLRKPPGSLMAVDTTDKGLQATELSIPDSLPFLYQESA